MCESCLDAVERWLPKIDPGYRATLLLDATCYPCGNHADVETQIRELAEKTDGTLEGCIAFAERLNVRRIKLENLA